MVVGNIVGACRLCQCLPNTLTTRTIFAVITFILATHDLASDWVNYATFQSGQFSDNEHWNLQFVQPLLYITIASSLLYILEVIVLIFRLSKHAYQPMQRMEHVLSYLLWVVEDLGVLLIEYFVFRYNYCPLVKQFQTTYGRYALCASAVNILWRMFLTAIYYHHWRTRDVEKDSYTLEATPEQELQNQWEEESVDIAISNQHVVGADGEWAALRKKKRRIDTGKTVLQIQLLILIGLSIGFAAWCLKVAFSSGADIQKFVQVKQSVQVEFVVGRHGTSDSCISYENVITLGTIEHLITHGVVRQRMPCQDISPVYMEFIRYPHRPVLNEPNMTCHMIFTVKYKKDFLMRSIQYEIRNESDGTCIPGKLNDEKFSTIQSSKAWNEKVVKDICVTEDRVRCHEIEIPLIDGKVPYIERPYCDFTNCSMRVTSHESRLEEAKFGLFKFDFEEDREGYPCYLDDTEEEDFDEDLCKPDVLTSTQPDIDRPKQYSTRCNIKTN